MLWSIRVRGLALDCGLQIPVSDSFNKLACGFSKGWNPAEISQKVCHSVNYEFSIDNLSPKPYTLETLNFLQVLPADAVVVGAGVLPNTRFVEGLSLDKNGAIVVNPLLQAEACDNLFAAGDVCAYPALRTGQRVRIEHWDVAMQQGRVAAQNMLGKFQPFTTTPFFWSGLFGNLNLRFVGHAPEALDRVIIEGDVSNMEFISYYTEDDEIRAVATVNK
ncbi:AIFM3, partial [Symbiodinium necroappetens]